MQPIPTPEILDPDRILVNDRGDFTVDHESRASQLDTALHDSCAYAQQLWHNLDAVRAYLFNSLPADPHTPGDYPTTAASPSGPDDEQGWTNWITAYAAVTSTLCGPHGDSGYGLSEANHEASLRRTTPTPTPPDIHRELGPASPEAPPRPPPTDQPMPGRPRTARIATAAVLVLVALRGLRRHPPA